MIKINRGHHSDTGIGHIRGIPGTAQADLDDRDIHRCIGERGVRHRSDDLEEGHLDAVDLALINECDVRLDLTPHLVEALVGDRLAVNRDPLRHTHHVRAGESAGAQTIGPQQRFDHRSGAALAVRPGQMDDGIHPLGIAQEFGQRPDPPQAGCDTMFRPATGERGDDFGMSLFGRHDAQSLGRCRVNAPPASWLEAAAERNLRVPRCCLL